MVLHELCTPRRMFIGRSKVELIRILYAPYVSKGYVHSKTVNITHKDGRPDTVLNTEWTQRGRIFLYEKLKVADILPLIERSVMDSAS